MVTNTAKRSEPTKKGFLSPFFRPFGMIVATFTYLFLAIFIAILVEWIGMWLWWGEGHAQGVMMSEITHLNDNFTTSFTGRDPAELAVVSATWVKALLTENPVSQFLNQIAFEQHDSFFFSILANWMNTFSAYFESALFVMMTISIRTTIVVLSVLILVLASLVSVIDGLVERELRNYGGDRDHSRLVHLGLYWAPKLAVASPVLYLAWPDVANPVFFFVPAICLFGVTNYIIFSKYQKRL